jgi:hypothetical protein
MEDKVRMVSVRRSFVHTRISPTWANPEHPSPLSAPPRPYLPGSRSSGTTRVPAPLWKRCALRHVVKCPQNNVYTAASALLLPMRGTANEAFGKIAELLYTYQQSPVKHAPLAVPLAFGGSRSKHNEVPSLPMELAFRIMPCIYS